MIIEFEKITIKIKFDKGNFANFVGIIIYNAIKVSFINKNQDEKKSKCIEGRTLN